MIKVTLTNEILKRILEIDEKRFAFSTIEMPPVHIPLEQRTSPEGTERRSASN